MDELIQVTREYGDAHRAMAQVFLKKHSLPVGGQHRNRSCQLLSFRSNALGPCSRSSAHISTARKLVSRFVGFPWSYENVSELPREEKDTEKFLRILRKAFNDKITQVGLRIVDRYDELHRDEKSWILVCAGERNYFLLRNDRPLLPKVFLDLRAGAHRGPGKRRPQAG